MHDYILDGIIPSHVIELMDPNKMDQLGIDCNNCDMANKCHVLVDQYNGSYKKLCTVLFHDTAKPTWKMEDVI